MKKIFVISAVLLIVAACSPVLHRNVMDQGTRDVHFKQLRESPDEYKGKLFILGGVIVETRFTATGSMIEALSVPVNSLGYLHEAEHSQGRFLALYPQSSGLLDPVIYRKGREITLAGEFVEARKGKIDEMEYVYPVFEIREIYLWEEQKDYYVNQYYYNPWYDPYLYRAPIFYDPWGRPYYNWPSSPGW
jgi:outer membrane lipoprotein